MKSEAGFTLIEIVIALVIIGILSIVAMPVYVDLAQDARISSTKSSVHSIRSYSHMAYAQRAMDPAIGSSFPPSISASDFANNQQPLNHLNQQSGIENVTTVPAGTQTSASHGFWYRASDGSVGAYSDGTVNTEGW